MNKQQVIQTSASSDLGKNAHVLHEFIKEKTNSTFVDIGVRDGYSSAIFALDSKKNNNVVYGVDVNFNNLRVDLIKNQNYFQLEGDSSTIGKYVEIEELNEVDVIFVDSLHVKQQVLCELFYWVPRLKNGGTVVFHDSHWEEGQYAVINGKSWARVDEAIVQFFGLESLANYEDDNLKVVCYPESYGMTFVTVTDVDKIKSTVPDWNKVFQERNELMAQYWNKDTVGDRTIELEMTYEIN